jgi:hypothetical protein
MTIGLVVSVMVYNVLSVRWITWHGSGKKMVLGMAVHLRRLARNCTLCCLGLEGSRMGRALRHRRIGGPSHACKRSPRGRHKKMAQSAIEGIGGGSAFDACWSMVGIRHHGAPRWWSAIFGSVVVLGLTLACRSVAVRTSLQE